MRQVHPVSYTSKKSSCENFATAFLLFVAGAGIEPATS